MSDQPAREKCAVCKTRPVPRLPIDEGRVLCGRCAATAIVKAEQALREFMSLSRGYSFYDAFNQAEGALALMGATFEVEEPTLADGIARVAHKERLLRGMNTEIIVVTDRSGSMGRVANDVIGGYNQFIEEQKAAPGEARVTFAQFDDVYEVVYAGTPLSEVPKLTSDTYTPRGWTALLDAIGRTVNEQKARIEADGWADKVVVCIITDGNENSSVEFKLDDIRKLTSQAEARGWKFIYLGANQDSFAETQNLGMKQATTQNFVSDSSGTRSAYSSISDAVRSVRGGS